MPGGLCPEIQPTTFPPMRATAQEAALQEKNADLQSNIATVVNAAVDGDFSRRIALQDGVEDPSGLLNGVNGIGEVDAIFDALCVHMDAVNG